MKKGINLWWLLMIIITIGGVSAVYVLNIENPSEKVLLLFLGEILLMMLKSQVQEEKKGYRQLVERNELLYQIEELKKAQTANPNDIGEVVAKAVDKSMKPVFEDIDKGMKELLDGFGNIYKNGVENIVDNFVEQMNKSMGGQFAELGKSIEVLCEWQEKSIGSMSNVLNDLSSNTMKIKDIYAYTERIIKQLDSYYKKLDTLQDGIRKTFEEMRNCDGLYDEVTRRQEKCVESFNKHEGEFISILGMLKDSTNDYNVAIRNSIKEYDVVLAKQGEKIASVQDEFVKRFNKSLSEQIKVNQDVSKEMQLLIDNSAKHLKEVSGKYDKDVAIAMGKTFEAFDKCMAEISGHISTTVADINEISVNIPRALGISIRELQKQFSGYVTSIEEMRTFATRIVTEIKEKVEKGEIITPVELSDVKVKKRTRRTKKELEEAKATEAKKTESKTKAKKTESKTKVNK